MAVKTVGAKDLENDSIFETSNPPGKGEDKAAASCTRRLPAAQGRLFGMHRFVKNRVSNVLWMIGGEHCAPMPLL